MCRPVADEPVNEITWTSGFSTIASPTSPPAPVTRLTVPGREAGLGHQLDEQRRAMGRVARRLEDDGVAGHEGRHHLPARDRDREVPGRDDPGDPDRLADAHRPLVGQLRRAPCRRTSGGPRRPSGRRCRCPPGRRRGPPRGPCPSPGSSPATSRSLCSAISAPKRYRISPRFGAGVRRHSAPATSAARIGHRDVRRGPLLEAPDDVARVGRVVALEGRAGRRIAPLPGDEVAERRRLGGRPVGGSGRRRSRSSPKSTLPRRGTHPKPVVTASEG